MPVQNTERNLILGPMGVFLSEFYDTGVEQKNKVITYVQVFYEILSKHDHKHFW